MWRRTSGKRASGAAAPPASRLSGGRSPSLWRMPYPPATYQRSRCHVFRGKQMWVQGWDNRVLTRGASIESACGDTWQADGTSLTPPAAARAVCHARAAATRPASPADAEGLPRLRPPPRARTPWGRTGEETRHPRCTVPCESLSEKGTLRLQDASPSGGSWRFQIPLHCVVKFQSIAIVHGIMRLG